MYSQSPLIRRQSIHRKSIIALLQRNRNIWIRQFRTVRVSTASIQQIYEPPLQYHYLKRPYQLIPLTVESVPKPRYFDAEGNPLPEDVHPELVAKAVYEIRIRPGIQYQPHPCFAKDAAGKFPLPYLDNRRCKRDYEVSDFSETGTRELIAEDYVHQLKRLADPRVACPLLSLLDNYILGMGDYATALRDALEGEREKRRAAAGATYNQAVDERANPISLNIDAFPFPGVKVVDRYTYQIVLKTKYPQFVYWLAMPFFAPMPKEVIAFYEQTALKDRNITIDRFPIGTGPYRLETFKPHKEIVLIRNENFRTELYPTEGEIGDREAGLLANAGAKLPLIPKAVYKLEKEYIPRWLNSCKDITMLPVSPQIPLIRRLHSPIPAIHERVNCCKPETSYSKQMWT